jgi:hypothetical protein
LLIVPVFLLPAIPEPKFIPIQHIGIHIGHPPAYLLVEADHYARGTRQRHPAHVNAGSHQLHLVPDRRQVELQVRVVGQQGIAGGGFGPGHGPVVAAQLSRRLPRQLLPGEAGQVTGRRGRDGQRGKVCFCAHRHNGILPERIIREKIAYHLRPVLVEDITHAQVIAAARQVIGHHFQEQGTFERGPGLGGIIEQFIFQRIGLGRQALDVGIHPGRIGLQHIFGCRVGQHGGQRLAGTIHHAHAALEAVEVQGLGADDLRHPACRRQGLKLHLP